MIEMPVRELDPIREPQRDEIDVLREPRLSQEWPSKEVGVRAGNCRVPIQLPFQAKCGLATDEPFCCTAAGNLRAAGPLSRLSRNVYNESTVRAFTRAQSTGTVESRRIDASSSKRQHCCLALLRAGARCHRSRRTP